MPQLIKKSKLNILSKLFLSYCLFFGFFFLMALILSIISLNFLYKHNLKKASAQARLAIWPTQVIRVMTASQLNSLKAWEAGLRVISRLSAIETEIKNSAQLTNQDNQQLISPLLFSNVNSISTDFQQFIEYSQQSPAAKMLLSQNQEKQFFQLADNLSKLNWLLSYLSRNKLEMLFLLQNSDELRAGGGFVGSLAAVSLDHGSLTQPTFYDIYDFANRAGRLPNSPVGVEKYLSADRGLSLTDVNWEADFSESAKNYQKLIKNTELPEINTIVGLSLATIKEVIEVIGPVNLIDSHQTVYADNLEQLARLDREDFFAGDKRKKLFLTELFTAIKLELPNLEVGQLLELAEVFSKNISQKNLIFYSSDSELQQFIVDHNAGGVINFETDFFLYLPESNVGINKANGKVTREIQLKFNPQLITATITFFNDNLPLAAQQIQAIRNNPDLLQAEHMGYINYQRLITNLPFKQTQVICDGQDVTLEEETTISTWLTDAKQVGFLVKVPEQNSVRCIIAIQPEVELLSRYTWTVVRQPGLPPTVYEIDYFSNKSEFYLDKDAKIGGGKNQY